MATATARYGAARRKEAMLAQAIQLAELLACRASYFLGVLALAGTLSVVSTVKAGLRYVEKRARRRDGATEAR
jgi:hypothetical protein